MKIIKKILLVIAIIIGLILVAWRIDRTFFHPYLPDISENIRDAITTTKFTIPKDKINCEKAGGVWKKFGPRPVEECNLPTTDGGKPCTSSNVCEGICRANLTQDQLSQGMRGKLIKTSGSCSPWVKQIGCYGIVYLGWTAVVCVD